MTRQFGLSAAVAASAIAGGAVLGYIATRGLTTMRLTTFAVYVLVVMAAFWAVFSPKQVSVFALLLLPVEYYKQLGEVYITNAFGLSLIAFLAVTVLYRRLVLKDAWVVLPFTLVLLLNAFRGVDSGEATTLSLAYVGGLMLLFVLVTTRPRLEIALAALVLGGTLFSAWHILTYFSTQAFTFSDPYEQKRVVGDVVGNANILGIYVASIAVLSLGFVLDRRLRASLRLASFLAFAVNCLGTAVTLSRSAWLGLAVVLVLLSIRNWRSIATLLFGGVGLAGVLALLPNASFQVRLLTILNAGSDAAIVDRLLGWRSAWMIIWSWPIFGIGFPNFRYKYYLFLLPGSKEQLIHAHNIFLTIWAELGLVGLLAFVLILGLLVGWYHRVQPALRDYAAVILGGIGVILVAGLTEYSFNGQHIVFLFYSLVGMYLLTLCQPDHLPVGESA